VPPLRSGPSVTATAVVAGRPPAARGRGRRDGHGGDRCGTGSPAAGDAAGDAAATGAGAASATGAAAAMGSATAWPPARWPR
jgi:hypothetical protein